MEMQKLKIAVLSGGPSGEREVSLKSGENVVKQLSKEKYDVTRILIVNESEWQITSDTGAISIHPANEEGKKVLQNFDIFFNALHGPYGEDGGVQKTLEGIGVKYTGSGVVASERAMDKALSMKLTQEAGYSIPDFFEATEKKLLEDISKEIKERFSYPVIVKPNSSGSTLGLSLVHGDAELEAALGKALAESARVIIQRYIAGREFTCGVMGNKDGELEALLPIEIVVQNKVFDFEDKYVSKETKEICPAPVDDVLMKKIQDFAVAAHRILGCDGLSRSDFRMDEDENLYYLETNTSPGMTEASLCPKEAYAAGLTMSQFLDRIISLALAKKH